MKKLFLTMLCIHMYTQARIEFIEGAPTPQERKKLEFERDCEHLLSERRFIIALMSRTYDHEKKSLLLDNLTKVLHAINAMRCLEK